MIWKKYNNILFGALAIYVLVLLCHFFIAPITCLWQFSVGVACLIVGDVIFLMGIDSSVIQMGTLVGSTSGGKTAKLVSVLVYGFIFGIFSTMCEPEMQVLSVQVAGMGFSMTEFMFLLIAGFGVGLFVVFGLLRSVFKIPLSVMLLVMFAIVFGLMSVLPEDYVALAFDAGGASTGAVTAPFLIALAASFSRSRSSRLGSKDDDFGLIAIASFGPILALLVCGLFVDTSFSGAVVETASASASLPLEILKSVTFSVVPLVALFLLYNFLVIRVSKKKLGQIVFSSLVLFVGLFVLLFGLEFGLMSVGEQFGEILGSKSYVLTIVVGVVLGLFIAFTEPTVRVIGKKVQDYTNNNIKSNFVVYAIAIALALAVGISVVRVLFGVSFWWLVGVGYGLALLMMFFTPREFVGIAFDAAGIAAGPVSVAFICQYVIGVSEGTNSSVLAFGVLAMSGVTPLIVIEFLGIIFNIQNFAGRQKDIRILKRMTYDNDEFSNIRAMEKRVAVIMNKESSDEENY